MRALILIFAACLGLAGCKSMPSFSVPSLAPYKIDIQQGNYVDRETAAKLKPGMTRAQVRFIMGTPLVTDMFHSGRWDYVYIDNKAGKLVAKRRVAVYFDGDVAQRIVEVMDDGKEVDIKAAPPAAETAPAGVNAPAAAEPADSTVPAPPQPAAGSK
ncbi:hypothetical protein TPL01_16580 [Sulfuriferula plumbiphila]|uniref:Outer membrane protein assembly factor BamE n=1 Tax=Sulfuriferula plumbiphila TaxID=171865 RepID=A0A512L7Q8_9PROT|nr:outer membrane protein assembly factor BamE [Sulfuriferula plumbiphila]BBP03963.1 hypothetical protein SFPGR_13850 [Sulfuriferula plumbiphila]GEP30520.1 hypothetical protein TPL01_16580 [Sulfuriferula plumbiphila]